MKHIERKDCTCGRIAATETTKGEFVCWEKYLPDDPIKWKDKYPRDSKPRHGEDNDKKKA